jgi:hypothetical protein
MICACSSGVPVGGIGHTPEDTLHDHYPQQTRIPDILHREKLTDRMGASVIERPQSFRHLGIHLPTHPARRTDRLPVLYREVKGKRRGQFQQRRSSKRVPVQVHIGRQ